MVNQKSGSGISGDTLYSSLNIAAGNRATIDAFSSCSFIFTLSEEISNLTVEILQDFFKRYPLGITFNRELKKVNKELTIVASYSDQTQNVPQVTVESLPVDGVPVSLGNRNGLVEDAQGHLYEHYTGLANLNTTLSIRDTGKRNVAKLADVLFLALMQFVPFHMGTRFVNVRPQVKFSNPIKETGSKLGGEIYLTKLNVIMDAEWHQYMEVVAPTVDGIEVDSTPDNS
jgi:hypothetical protein